MRVANHTPILDAKAMPFLLSSLKLYVPPHPKVSNALMKDEELRNTLMGADMEVLAEACEMCESVVLTEEDARFALAKDLDAQQVRWLASVLDFIELASDLDDDD